MRILATGGAGYVGSAVVRALLAQGHHCVVYDNLSKGHRGSIPEDCLVEADLADYEQLAAVLREQKIDAVMHFAGFIAVGESVENPRLYYRNNLGDSLSLLEAMVDAKVDKILFSSTAAVYAPIKSGVLQEDSPKRPGSPYAFSKYAFERLIQDFSRAYGMGFTILRYFNACGGSGGGHFGEAHDPETHLIPLVLQVPLGQRQFIGIFGNDYDTPDGTCIRDYIHVDDLADAHIRAVEAIGSGSGNFYNIGTGTGNSVLEVIEAAEEVTGQKIAAKMLGRRAGDVDRLIASADKLRRELGWAPRYTNLRDIIASAWQWHKSHPDGYK
jgi:UDP-glucose 4-epimerase